MTTYRERIYGAVLCHAVGDALGVPVEFVSREKLGADPVKDMGGYGTHQQPPGTWSDDTSLMLCLLESLKQGLDYNDLAKKFIAWRDEGYWTPHGDVFDIGITTSRAISKLKAGVPPLEAGEDGERSNGNGSLMRILPIAFLHNLSDKEMARTAEQVSCLTHRHPRSQMACGLFVLFCRRLFEGSKPVDAFHETVRVGRDLYQRFPFREELPHFERFLDPDLAGLSESDIRSSGYVVHTLEASTWCFLTTTSFEEAVLKAVNLGGDSDTTGAVTGGLAGAAYGLDAIPDQWTRSLARSEEIMELVNSFIQMPANPISKTIPEG